MNQLEKKYEHYNKIKDAIEYLDENYQYQPKLDDVASHIGLSKHHFARVFKEYVGITPMQFLQATTFSHAKESLKNSKSRKIEVSNQQGLLLYAPPSQIFYKFDCSLFVLFNSSSICSLFVYYIWYIYSL